MAWTKSNNNLSVPKEQQIEGLKFVLAQVSPREFIRSLNNLQSHNFMSKSAKHEYIKRMRHILGMSYEEYCRMKK